MTLRRPWTPTRRADVALALALMATLCAVYLFSYTGRMEIADQLQYFDAAGSVAMHGVPLLDVSLWQWMPRNPNPNQPFPFRATLAEPNFIHAAAGLVWLAQAVEGLGLAHTAWLFNVFATPALGGLMFAVARAQGYPRATAGVLAVGFGTLTIAWAYSQTFFREPLMMIFLVGAALALERARRADRWRVGVWGAVALILLWLAYHTKDATLLALPGIAALALLPGADSGLWRRRWARRLSWAGMGALVTVAGAVTYTPLLDVIGSALPQGPLFANYRFEPQFTREAFHTYMFSLGGSWWGTSPALLLAIPGVWLLLRQGAHRQAWGCTLILLGFTGGYALFRGEEWFGGTIWPQRFLLPALPFVAFACLPVIARWLEVPAGRARRRLTVALAALALYSLWWQAVAISFNWYAYGEATFELSDGGLVYWSPGFNDLRYIRPVVLTGLIGSEPLNFAWARTGITGAAVAALALAALGGWAAWRIARARHPRRGVVVLAWVSPLLAVGLAFVSVRAYYWHDPLYMADNADLHRLAQVIREQTEPGDVVLVNDPEYASFLYNYGRFGAVWTVILPYHPGDRGSCEQELALESDNPAVLLASHTHGLIHHLAGNRPRLWLMMSTGADIPCVVRPLERWMGATYHRVGEWAVSPRARLLMYHTAPAPPADRFRGAQHPADLTFIDDTTGAQVRLAGYSLAHGNHYRPGDPLALSLVWQADETPTRDYTVAWFVADAGGAVVAEGENTWHNATFTPTSLFPPGGVPVWDHRALLLPPDLAPGAGYQLWVRLYDRDPHTGALRLLRIAGDPQGILRDPNSGDIGVLTREIVLE